jgi:hypothetical protein
LMRQSGPKFKEIASEDGKFLYNEDFCVWFSNKSSDVGFKINEALLETGSNTDAAISIVQKTLQASGSM